MTYAYFERINNESKGYFDTLMTIKSMSNKKGTCIVDFEGRESEVSIEEIVSNVVSDGMGAVSNPSKLKNWKGFNAI